MFINNKKLDWKLMIRTFLIFFLVLIIIPQRIYSKEILNKDTLPVEEFAKQALVDTLYYKFYEWIPCFKKRIEKLEAQPQTLKNQFELMKFYFYFAGLYGEMTHALSFTGEFKIDEIKNNFTMYSDKSKSLAKEILDQPGLTRQQKADAYFFLGVSEGYVGLMAYGQGRFIAALINGLSADNHLEDALRFDPNHADAYVGLGVYRYGNTRLGGLGNFVMQWGKDHRQLGLEYLERALKSKIMSRPLAIKTLIWFYISEEINPANKDLEKDHPLHREKCRKRALDLIKEYESLYFDNISDPEFLGNKGLKVMKAIQFVLDGNYLNARGEFQKALDISQHLIRIKSLQINPKYMNTIEAAKQFCELMLAAKAANNENNSAMCVKLNEQIQFIENGGSLIEYQSAKIRKEIQDVFYHRLKKTAKDHQC